MDDKFYKAYAEKLNELQSNSSNKELDWDALSLKLSKKEKRRRAFAYFWSVLLAFLTIITITFISQKPTKKPAIQIVENKLIAAQLKKGTIDSNCSNNTITNTTENPRNKKHAYLSSSPNTSIEANFSSRIQISPKPKNTIISKNNAKNNSVPNLHTIITNENILSSSFPMTGSKKENEAIIPDANFELDNINPIQTISSEFVIQNDENKILKFNSLPDLIKPKSNKWIYLRLFTGPLFDTKQNNNQTKDPLAIHEHILKTKLGYHLGGSLYYQKTEKLRYGLGLQYNYSSFITDHHVNVTPEKLSHTSTGNGIKKYEFAYNTFDGNIQSRVNLSLFEIAQNQMIKHNDTFDLNMSITRKTHTFLMPLFLERKIASYKKIKIYTKLGTNIKLHSIISNTLNHQTESCKELCFVNGFEPKIVSEVENKLSISGIVGLNFELKLNPKILMGIGPEIVIHPNQNNTSWFHQQAISAYISYQFLKR